MTTTSSGAGSAALTPAERLTGGPPRSRQPGADNPAASAGSPALSNPRAGGASGNGPILPGIRITADVTNNSLLIYANEESYSIIEGALRQIDRPQLQVAFDATIAEVTLNDSLTYGVQFFLKSTNVGAPPDTGSAINTIGSAVLSRVLPGFNILIGSEATPQVVIDALHAITDVKILSNPSLVVVGQRCRHLASRRPGSDHHRHGDGAQREQRRRQHHQLSEHRHHLARRSPRQLQQYGEARYRTGNQQRLRHQRAGHADADHFRAESQKHAVGRRRPDRAAGGPRSAKRKTRRATAFRCSTNFPVIWATHFPIRTRRRSAPNSSSSSGRRSSATPIDAHLVAEELRAKLKSRIGAVSPQSSIGHAAHQRAMIAVRQSADLDEANSLPSI